MKRKSIIGVALVAILGIVFQSYYSIQATPETSNITKRYDCPIAVVFDLGGVLVETSKRSAIWQIGPKNVFSYLARTHSTQIKKSFYETLDLIDGTTGNKYGAKDPDGDMLPNLFTIWLRGKQPNEQLLAYILEQIEQHPEWFKNKQVQNVTSAMAQFTFDPKNFINACHPIYGMMAFARECKEKGYKLYILSNWDPESFELLKQKYPELLELFDGAVISGQTHKMKPNPKMFALITEKVPAYDCIFIDDQQENIEAARSAGMHTIFAKPRRALVGKTPDMQAVRARFSCLEKIICSCSH